jgi:hypothetical protein
MGNVRGDEKYVCVILKLVIKCFRRSMGNEYCVFLGCLYLCKSQITSVSNVCKGGSKGGIMGMEW